VHSTELSENDLLEGTDCFTASIPLACILSLFPHPSYFISLRT
jgi:hypothetical protein